MTDFSHLRRAAAGLSEGDRRLWAAAVYQRWQFSGSYAEGVDGRLSIALALDLLDGLDAEQELLDRLDEELGGRW
ncbi:MAG: hypothetical protein IPM45_04960 [Acidimicrobiales bacterium]|nr:hypothetical protein [Acidimicrobiales bacterium]